MQIGAKKVVTIEYTLKDDAGEVLDSSEGGEPLTYIHGLGNIIPGLEKVLEGKAAGDAVEATVTPDEGYGRRDEKLIRNIPLRKVLDPKPKAGGRYRAKLDEGMAIVTVISVKGDYASIDANHPLADKTLHFAVKVVKVREATADELTHGHVHGEGGHHH